MYAVYRSHAHICMVPFSITIVQALLIPLHKTPDTMEEN